ncbi:MULTISPECIES: lantibiotic dehydratase [Sphingobacterium]|uniref:lantibiotic dehydratase n=1 Tax=Sphingobacterium TaxID=28453 RepID=UPI0028AD103E|nr:thiopeptide-type bacteriocin biosynthesis protein [Sphingobacterium multivorum]
MKIHSQLMIRVPQFPYDAKLEVVWEELLESIQYASPEFYQKVALLNPQSLNSAPAKVVQTLYKYFNRAKFRPTPLGTFSSFGITHTESSKHSQLIINTIRTIHLFTDWRYSKEVEYDFSDVLEKDLKLFANSTYYQVGNSVRYVRRKEETFELAEVAATKELLMVLKALKAPLQIRNLMQKLQQDIEEQQLLNLVEAMILCNLILTEFDPNTLGNDYFTRIGQFNYHTPKPYIISELSIANGSVSNNYFKHFPELIRTLTNILPSDTNGIHLKEFISNYTKLFDRKNIPIMQALDPQIGVGYGNLSKGESTNSIIALLTQYKEDNISMQSEQLKSFFRQGLKFKVGETLDLGLIPDHLLSRQSDNKLPNTFSIIGSISDEHFLLERIGGHTANQLAGRFSLCGGQALQYAQGLVKIEEEANPEIVFFDIAYHAELDVDNINRRPQLYQQELNIISYPGVEEPLTLDDLYITVSGNSIVLRSERLGKRVVPRMASAYNYRRSQLPVFRFLYDLAFYGVWPELTFDIKQLLPGLTYYPKVIYNNIILSLPRLVIKKEDFNELPEEVINAKVKKLLKEYQFGKLVKVLKGEEYAVYDLSHVEEMKLFIAEIKHQETITIEEMQIPRNALVKDENNHPFINQVIVPVVHTEELYPISAVLDNDLNSDERDYLPIKEWLYLDIFAHTLYADNLLLEPIKDLLESNKPNIEKWFFIRYNEHGAHLRLRIKAKQENLVDMVNLFNGLIQPYCKTGVVQDVKISTYRRELERYAIVGMENVESHFHKSSMLVLSLLNTNRIDSDKYAHCLRLMIGILESNLIGDKRFYEWTGFIRTLLEQEHKMETATFKALNKFGKENINKIYLKLSKEEQDFLTSLKMLIKRCPERRKAPLFTDLMHMHINRLFAEHQRTHELVCYNMLHQQLLKRKYEINTTYHAPELS